MEKPKTTLFSPIEYVEITNKEMGGFTVIEAIGINYAILQGCAFEPIFGKDEFSILLNKIETAISSPILQATLMEEWDSEISEEEIAIFINHFRHACLYMELARAAEKQNEHIKAWSFNNYASLKVGAISEKLENILKNAQAERLSTQNSKNAKEKDKNFIATQMETARLLKEMKPEEGWPSASRAAITLEKPLSEFIINNRVPGLTPSNIRTLVEKTWIPNNECVRSAWLSTKQSKSTNTTNQHDRSE
jgi:hypothetical protein